MMRGDAGFEVMSERELRREEVRGIFAIGMIAVLFSVNQRFGSIRVDGVPVEFLTFLLLFFWSLYVLLMAVGVSGDIFGAELADFCRDFGHFMFMAGATGFFMISISVPLFYFRDHHMTLPYDIGLSLFIAFFVGLYFNHIKADIRRSKPVVKRWLHKFTRQQQRKHVSKKPIRTEAEN
jgi:hypothetical protein